MAPHSLWWFDEPTRAVWSLHRNLSRACGALLVVVGAVSTLGAWPSGDEQGRVVAVAVGVGLMIGGILVFTGWRSWLLLAVLFTLTVVGQWASDPFGARISGTATYALLAFALLVPTLLRPLPAAAAVAAGIASYVLAVPHSDTGYALDMQALTIGQTAAEIGFLRMLFQSSRQADMLRHRLRAGTDARAAIAKDVDSLAEERRVLHDEVIGSLMTLASSQVSAQDRRRQASAALERLRSLEVGP